MSTCLCRFVGLSISLLALPVSVGLLSYVGFEGSIDVHISALASQDGLLARVLSMGPAPRKTMAVSGKSAEDTSWLAQEFEEDGVVSLRCVPDRIFNSLFDAERVGHEEYIEF